MAKKLKIEDIPEGYNYAAVDADGFAYAFKDRPIVCDDKHDVPPFNFGHHRYIGKGFDFQDWQNSLVSREPEQKPEIKKLTAADIPEGFNYAAVDSCGTAFAYRSKPVPHSIGSYWASDMEDSIEIEGYFDASDWKNSLVSREVEQKLQLKQLTADDIPQGYNYAVINSNGIAFATKGKPIKHSYGWNFVDTLPFVFIGNDFDSTNWRNSLVSSETNKRPELKKLTAADIPEGYNYAAVDKHGSAYAYFEKPLALRRVWVNEYLEQNAFFIGQRFDASDWQNSLVSRESIENEPAYKETNNKLSYSEIDPYFLEAMARRMNEGKKKYGPNNWKKLSDINELLDAVQRHLLELRKMMEEDFEPLPGQETDLQHCAALACNAMFIHYHLNPNT